MRFLVESNQRYYRLEVEGLGGLFRTAEQIIGSGYIEEDTPEYWINSDIYDLEMKLGDAPVINNPNAKFAYTEHGFSQIQDEIKDLEYNLNLLGYKLKIIKVEPNEIIYEDENQIAYL